MGCGCENNGVGVECADPCANVGVNISDLEIIPYENAGSILGIGLDGELERYSPPTLLDSSDLVEIKNVIATVKIDGDGNSFLSDDGTYKPAIDESKINSLITAAIAPVNGEVSEITGQISDIQQAAADMQQQITKNSSDISGILLQISDLADAITEINETLTSINSSISTLTNSLANKADATALASHTSNLQNPHAVNAVQVGLGNVDNTSDSAKPISTAMEAALDNKVETADLEEINAKIDAINAVIPSTATGTNQLADKDFVNSSINAIAANPLSYDAAGNPFPTRAALEAATIFYYRGVATTPAENDYVTVQVDETQNNAQVRYIFDGNVWVFSYKVNDQPLTEAQNAAINSGITATKLTAYDTHVSSTANPHAVTKSQVGLSAANNTSDAAKPISTATQTALNLKADTSALETHTGDTANPHGVTKAQVGLGNVDNTSDLSKPVSTATTTALASKANTSAFTAHTGDTTNPHAVTKAQVGLGNADNTSDLSKPVSTAVNSVVTAISNSIVTHTGDTTNPHEVTAAQVGLGNVDNTNDLSKPVSTATQTAIDAKIQLFSSEAAAQEASDANPKILAVYI
jgi:uncharacterized protein YoxC